MTAATWILVYKQPVDVAATTRPSSSSPGLAKGDRMAEELDYVPMPDKVVKDIEKTWADEIKDTGGKPLFMATN